MACRYKGYMGRWVEMDLTKGKVKDFPVSDEDIANYLGGKGLAAKILYDQLNPGVDPLGPKNILIINTGPLTASATACSSRFNATTKSPLSLGIGSSNCGGPFGIGLRRAGLDGIVIRGAAKSPVYIEIIEGKVAIKDAKHLWGKTTLETEEAFDKKFASLVIGPAGENLVRYACVLSADRALGRCGIGAVFGSKKIKAIVAKGTERLPFHNHETFKKLSQKWIKDLQEHPVTGDRLPKYGTANLVNITNKQNVLPTRNFKKGHYKDAHLVSGEYLAEHYLEKNIGCLSCPIRCGRGVRFQGKLIKGPEFETVGMFGPHILNNDMKKIIDWNYHIDLMGMDTISCGHTIGFAMELTEKGLLKSNLAFGKTTNIAKTIEDIAYRRGLGDDLAEGTMRMAQKYGGMEFANQSKGLEMAAYEPRAAVGHGLGYATANRGACHLNAGYLIYLETLGPMTMDPYTPHGKPGLVFFQQNLFEAVSSSGTCLFPTYAIIPGKPLTFTWPKSLAARIYSKAVTAISPLLNNMQKIKPWMLGINLPMIPYPPLISALTGMKLDLGKFLEIGERCWTIERLFNVREGLTGADDTLPKRLTDELQRVSEPRSKVPLDKMLPIYYKVRGWDSEGRPTKKLLRKLGIREVA